MEEYTVKFDLEHVDWDGEVTRLVKDVPSGEDGLYLPAVLRVLKDFLHTIGFSYIDELVGYCGNDREVEHSSDNF